MAKKKLYTIGEIIAAGMADETPKIKYAMVDESTGATCAIGGAAATLGVSPKLLEAQLNSVETADDRLVGLAMVVESLSDRTGFRKATVWKRILAKIEKYDPKLLSKRLRLA